MAGSAINVVDLEAQAIMILSPSQKDTLDEYLALDPTDPALKFDQFPEWEEVLDQLKLDIEQFYAENEGKVAGEDMPGFDSQALHMWHTYTGGLRELLDGRWIAPNINLVRTLTDRGMETLKWMDEVGLEPSYGASANSRGNPGLSTVLGAMWPRTHNFIPGKDRIEVLHKAALEHGVEIYTETRGTELILDESGRVVGAKAIKADGTEMTFNTANGVILASGGYCANPKMVKEYDLYWGDDLTDTTLTTNLGTNEGDGILMAQAVGADTIDLEIAQLMPSSSPVKGTMTDGVWADAGSQIWIDKEGKRFVNEYAERDVLAKASLELEDGIFYIIYAGVQEADGAMLTGAKIDAQLFGTTLQDMIDKGHVWYGEDLEDLAEKTKTPAAGVAPAFSADQLRKTIEAYNSYVETQKDPEFGKEVITGAIDLEAIENNEGFGIVITPRKASLHHTMGGIRIDEAARVLNKEGQPIPGLWAAGEVTGGLHAGNRLGGNAIADIFTFGRIAGQSAAENK